MMEEPIRACFRNLFAYETILTNRRFTEVSQREKRRFLGMKLNGFIFNRGDQWLEIGSVFTPQGEGLKKNNIFKRLKDLFIL